MKAREWVDRSLDQSDPIESFSNSWRGFNSLFFPCSGNTERDKIQNFLSVNITEAIAQELITNHTQEVTYLLSQPVIDMRGNGRDTASSISSYNNAGSYLEQLLTLFSIIYQVRCNLEHGQKSPTRERDIELCSSSWPLVAEVVDKNA